MSHASADITAAGLFTRRFAPACHAIFTPFALFKGENEPLKRANERGFRLTPVKLCGKKVLK